jgi:lipid A disaccharide synthetase
LFIKIIHRFKLANPGVKIFLPLAESIDKSKVEKILRQTETGRWGQDIVIVQGEQEKLRMLSSCCVALTKPGTITLELALLGVPSVVAYKAPWLTYFIARMLVKVDYMSLANLLLQEEVFPEFIQSDCKIKKILPALERFCSGCSDKKEAYQVLVQELGTLREVLKATPSSIQSLFSLPDHPEC